MTVDMATPIRNARYGSSNVQALSSMPVDMGAGEEAIRKSVDLAMMLLVMSANKAKDSLLVGKTLVVIGFGRTGRMVAQRAHYGLGMNIVVYDPSAIEAHHVERVHGKVCETLTQALSQADYVTIHCALDRNNDHLIGQTELNAMPEHAVIINTAAANLIDHQALLQSLNFETIGGAALDARNYGPATLGELSACEELILWSLPVDVPPARFSAS